MKLIGIDPGLKGAIAFLGDDNATSRVWDMPVMPKIIGQGNQVDPYVLAEILVDCIRLGARTVVVENVHAMPQQGGVSNFSFGKSMGIIEGVVGTLQLLMKPAEYDDCLIYYVTPHAWKKAAGLIKKSKDASRLKALELWPELKQDLSRKKDEGRAEALLIAKFGLDK